MPALSDKHGFKRFRFALKTQRQFIFASWILSFIFMVLVIWTILSMISVLNRIFSDVKADASGALQFNLDTAKQIKRLQRFWNQ
jgi:hypothetical protein